MRKRRPSEIGGPNVGLRRKPGTPSRPLPAYAQTPPVPASKPATEHHHAEDAGAEKDMRLGVLLLEARASTADQIEQCLRVQEQMMAMGAEAIPRLGEILVRRNFATIAQVEQALEVQESLGRTCTTCSEFSPALLLDMGDGDLCPHCGTKFGTRARVQVVPAGEDSDAIPAVTPGLKPHRPQEPELKVLGRYELTKELGRGSMGVVYEALDPSLNRRVALKLLHPDVRESSQDVQQFIKEAQLSANLPKHPNIVTVYEAGILEGRHFIAMERIEGVPLSSWRRKGSVAIRQQIRILRDVALAIHHAHENGILHCDLKPQNVMIDDRKRPYVTDFGLARRPGRDTWAENQEGMTAGTPAYMSPEQARGLLQLDRRTDIYSLGTMLYEIVTGRIPFRAKTPEELLNKTVKDPVRPPSAVARSLASIDPRKVLDKVCLKALAKKPGHRYPTARAFAEDLTRWLRGEVEQGRPRKKSSRTIWIRLAAGAAVVFAAFLLTRAWKDDDAPEPARPDSLQQARRELEQARLALQAKAKADAEALDVERRKLADLQEQAKNRGTAPASAAAHDPVEWLVAGPFDNRGIDEVLAPENAINTTAMMPGKSALIRWNRALPELRGSDGGRAAVFDFGALFTPNTQAVAYALIHVKAPAPTDALLLVGSDDGVKAWANGTVIHRADLGRGLKIDEDRVPFRLLKGWNLLLFKVTQRNQGWGLSVRITDAGKRPIDGLEYDPLGDLPQALPQAMLGR